MFMHESVVVSEMVRATEKWPREDTEPKQEKKNRKGHQRHISSETWFRQLTATGWLQQFRLSETLATEQSLLKLFSKQSSRRQSGARVTSMASSVTSNSV